LLGEFFHHEPANLRTCEYVSLQTTSKFSSTIPSDGAAVVYQGKFYIVYLRDDGRTCALNGLSVGRNDGAVGGPPCQMGDIKMNGEFTKVNVNEPKITAFSYTPKGPRVARTR
jgi:hypothetical protein